jgi:hypothetical protein
MSLPRQKPWRWCEGGYPKGSMTAHRQRLLVIVYVHSQRNG